MNPEVDLPSERPLERNPYAGPVAGSLTFLTCVVVLSAMAAMMFGDTSSGDLSLLKNIGQGAGFGLILSGVVLLIYWLYVLLQISAKANQEELEFRRTIREERRARKLARREEIEAEETSEPPPPVASQPDERITNPSRLQRQRPASQADPVQDTGDDSIN